MYFVRRDTSEGRGAERDISPLLARHSNALYLNRALMRIVNLYKRSAST